MCAPTPAHDQVREAEVLHVEIEHPGAHQRPQRDPEHAAQDRHHHRPLGEVQPEAQVGVADRLEHRDLFALDRDHPPEHHIEEERRDPQEDHGHQQRHAAEPGQFVLEIPVGDLLGAGDGAQAAVGLEEAVQFGDRRLGGGALGERQRDVVEPALHVEGGREVPARHPEDPEPRRVRQEVAAGDRVDVLGGKRRPDDLEPLAPAVDHREDLVAEFEPVPLGEALVDDRLLGASGVGPAPAAQRHAVQDRAAAVRERDKAAVDRLAGSRDVQGDAGRHPGVRPVHPGELVEAPGDPAGDALGVREDVPELVSGVVAVARRLQRVEADERRDQQRDPRRDHHRDGEPHGAHPPEVAEQLAVESGDHGVLTTGSWRRRPASRWRARGRCGRRRAR